MGWMFLKTERLPLGARVLKYGMKGADVAELQILLKKAGFYGARTDGVYGALTREAVLLFQKTFALRVDGIAGRQVIRELKNVPGGGVTSDGVIKDGVTCDGVIDDASKGGGALKGGALKGVGRIIYTVKTGDTLEKISQEFHVRPTAWQGLFHQGTTLKKIYPGMKLLLREKAVFTWETAPRSPQKEASDLPLTGHIITGWRLDAEAKVCREPTESDPQHSFYLLQADSQVWEKVFLRRKLMRKLAGQLQSLDHLNFGFDLRNAPLSTIPYWTGFIKFMARQNPRRKKIKFLLVPLINPVSGVARVFWANLPILSRYTQILMLEPELNFETPLSFINTARQSRRKLRRINQLGISHQCAVVCEAGAWDWDLEANCYQPITLKKARLIRAMYPREVEYFPECQYTTIHYTHRSRRHCLIYRDDQGWDDFFKLLNRFNFCGTVIREFHRLGDKGLPQITGAFAILPQL